MNKMQPPEALRNSVLELDPAALDLDYLACIAFSGDDTETFLQSQFTNDVSKLQPGQQQLGAYCNPKGRILCLFRLLRTESQWLMILPGDLSDSMIKRLTLYRMRAKVTIDLDQSNRITGVIHPRQVITNTDAVKANWSLDDHRMIMITDGDTDLAAAFDVEIRQDANLWKLGNLLSGIPEVYLSTTEQFIPQHVNLDLVDGVSFGKGCYPGQEIVARLRYLGKLKQRMYAVWIRETVTCQVGDPVYNTESGDRKVGQVVETVAYDGLQYALLSLPTNAMDRGDTRIGSADGPAVSRIDLPYEVTV